MRIDFTNGGATYSLIVSRASRRELEAVAEDIQPDRSLLSSAQRKAALNHRVHATAREIHAAGSRGST